MIQFTYTIQDPQGIHARPAGMLVKEAAKFSPNAAWPATARPGT